MDICEKATAHDCEFVWSSTCCIDKTSSSELESIRPMFKWYKNSQACIVYLGESM
ncbi:hypothetical protein EDB19DRAFT_1640985 [Suillus lakei]|nr:hypothetical protein EDB19DRAFT_1640985 [Suillus lakei]